MILLDLYTCIIIVLHNYFNYKYCTLYTQFSLRTASCSFLINDFTTKTFDAIIGSQALQNGLCLIYFSLSLDNVETGCNLFME